MTPQLQVENLHTVLSSGGHDLVVRGEVPDAAKPPRGCRFHPRCPLAEPICSDTAPSLESFGAAGDHHLLSCHVVRREGVGAAELEAAKERSG